MISIDFNGRFPINTSLFARFCLGISHLSESKKSLLEKHINTQGYVTMCLPFLPVNDPSTSFSKSVQLQPCCHLQISAACKGCPEQKERCTNSRNKMTIKCTYTMAVPMLTTKPFDILWLPSTLGPQNIPNFTTIPTTSNNNHHHSLKTVTASSTEIHVFNSIKLLISPPKSPNFPSKNSPRCMVWGLARTSKMIGRSNQGSKKWTPWGPMCFSPLFRWGESAGLEWIQGSGPLVMRIRKLISSALSPWVFLGSFRKLPKTKSQAPFSGFCCQAPSRCLAYPRLDWNPKVLTLPIGAVSHARQAAVLAAMGTEGWGNWQ